MTDPAARGHGAARLVIRCAPLFLPFLLITPLFAPTGVLPRRSLPVAAPPPHVSVAVTGVRPQAARQLGILTSPTALEITGVLPSSPAARAGISTGDVVRSIDSVAVARPEDLPRLLHTHPPGHRLVVGIVRGGRQLRAYVTLDPERAGASQAPGSDAR